MLSRIPSALVRRTHTAGSGARRLASVKAPINPAGGQVIPMVAYGLSPATYVANTFPRLRGYVLKAIMGGLSDTDKSDKWRNYEPSPDDTIVACAVKSGTNWLCQITYQIASRGRGEYEHIHDVMPFPDGIFPHAKTIESLRANSSATVTGKNVIKTHCTAKTFDETKYTSKFITIVRDPKEVIASAYPFLLGSWGVALDSQSPKGVTLDEWIDTIFEQKGMIDEIASHTASFWNRRHLPNYLFLNFRDIKADSRGSIERIAEHMGVELSPSELDAVCEKASIGYMKGLQPKFAAYGFKHDLLAPTIRSGKSGGAVGELGIDHCRKIDAHMRALLKQKAPDFPYAEMFDVV